jgi:hypothetical protein
MVSILQVQAQKKSGHRIQVDKNSHFGDSRVEGPKNLHQDS